MAGVEIENVLSANNTGGGLSINLGFIIGSTTPVSVNVANVTMRNESLGVAAENLVAMNGSITIADLLIDKAGCPQPEHPAIHLSNKGTDGPDLLFDRIRLNSCSHATSSPVRFDVKVNPSGSGILRSAFGGIEMRDILIHPSSGSAAPPFLNVSMLVNGGCWPINSTHCWDPRFVDMANVTGSFRAASCE